MWPPRAIPCWNAPLYSSVDRASARMVSGCEASTSLRTSVLLVISDGATLALKVAGLRCAGPHSNRGISGDHVPHPPSSTRQCEGPSYLGSHYLRASAAPMPTSHV